MRGGPRLVRTYYNGGDRPSHSKTVEAAIRAAFSRLVVGDYHRAQVYDANLRLSATLSRSPSGVRVNIMDWTKL